MRTIEGVLTNPVERESAAVDEVLGGLQELDAWPVEPTTVVKADDEASAVTEAELSFAAVADAEGGMVMLEANGDANYSDVNLASRGRRSAGIAKRAGRCGSVDRFLPGG